MPVTPDVLKWARERSGIALEAIKQAFPKIDKWEQGITQPTYLQLERLAKKYKYPLAIFFLPEPPQLSNLEHSFRTLQNEQFDAIPSAARFMLRKAKVLQENIIELNNGQNSKFRSIFLSMQFKVDEDITLMAHRARDYFDITISQQRSWQTQSIAFENWRKVFEEHGIAVFKDAFKHEEFSAFCLYHEHFPVIYLNNSVATRNIFSLFHELSHLLFQTSGIDYRHGSFYPDSSENLSEIETRCNQFAAEFLLPNKYLDKELRNAAPNESTASAIARRYNVSRELVFRRFLDRQLVDYTQYREASDRWQKQTRTSNIGGDYYNTKITYLGMKYIDLVFSKYYDSEITDYEAIEYLGIKGTNFAKLEERFREKKVKLYDRV